MCNINFLFFQGHAALLDNIYPDKGKNFGVKVWNFTVLFSNWAAERNV